MAHLIGQVFNPRFYAATEASEGKEAKQAMLTFSLSQRKQRTLREGELPNTFMSCVVRGNMAIRINEYYGKEEHKAKWISVYGNYDEREWEPDVANADQAKYTKVVTITKELLVQLGFKLAADNAKESVKIKTAGVQIDKQFFVIGFEFVGAAPGAPTTPAATPASTSAGFVVVNDDAAGTPVTTGAPNSDDMPF